MFYGGGVHFPSESKSTMQEGESAVELSLDASTKEPQRRFGDKKDKIQIEPIAFKHGAEDSQDANGLALPSPELREPKLN